MKSIIKRVKDKVFGVPLKGEPVNYTKTVFKTAMPIKMPFSEWNEGKYIEEIHKQQKK